MLKRTISMICIIVVTQSSLHAMNTTDCEKNPIINIAQVGNLNRLNAELAAGTNPHCLDSTGANALHSPAYWGKPQMVSSLLNADVNPNQCHNTSKATPLINAVLAVAHSHIYQTKAKMFSGPIQTVVALLDKNADPNQADFNGQTPLHYAALWNLDLVTRLLMAYGADQTKRNRDGRTPLNIARRASSWKVINLLDKTQE